MQTHHAQVIVAGHICLDIIPTFGERGSAVETLLVPGQLVHVGPAVISTGGAVSNTGLALQRLGVSTRLLGKVGDDFFGRAILDILRSHDPALVDGMIVATGEHTSYTLVISVPGVDRIFFHSPGANDTLAASDISSAHVRDAKLFHFGYPPLMRRMCIDGGAELRALLQHMKDQGLTTSLDMAQPDPQSEAGRIDWPSWLQHVLPAVDLFLPSLDEILFMLYGPSTARTAQLNGTLLAEVAQALLAAGAAVVALKLGSHGLYVRTTNELARLSALGRCAPPDAVSWANRELFVPCFQANVVGTTGAGDCTIAGFLAGLLRQLPLEDIITGAVAVGACSVEQADATSGIPPWSSVQQRLSCGWAAYPLTFTLQGWRQHGNIWRGPNDAM